MATGVNSYEQRGRAFCELIEHLPENGFGRGGIGVMVHLDYPHLLDQLASARLDTGVDITAGEARRLACTAGIIPTVLDGDSIVLDLGRSQRLHSPSQARALSVAMRPVPPKAASVPSPGATSTTDNPGPKADLPTSPTPSRCAAGTTDAPTTQRSTSGTCRPGKSDTPDAAECRGYSKTFFSN